MGCYGVGRVGGWITISSPTDSQFYANDAETRKRDESTYKNPVDLDIRHILARLKHPQINGKMEWLHGEIECNLHRFEASSYSSTVKNSESGNIGGQFDTER